MPFLAIEIVDVLPAPAVVGDSLVLTTDSYLYIWNGSAWISQGEGRKRHQRVYTKAFHIVDEIPNTPVIGTTVLLSTESILYTLTEMGWVAGGGVIGVVPGTQFPTWIDLATGWNAEPVLHTALAGGDVYTYTFNNGGPYYRYIADDGSIDAFYESFDGVTLSGLVVEKEITL